MIKCYVSFSFPVSFETVGGGPVLPRRITVPQHSDTEFEFKSMKDPWDEELSWNRMKILKQAILDKFQEETFRQDILGNLNIHGDEKAFELVSLKTIVILHSEKL